MNIYLRQVRSSLTSYYVMLQAICQLTALAQCLMALFRVTVIAGSQRLKHLGNALKRSSRAWNVTTPLEVWCKQQDELADWHRCCK
ncbi:MAG: hypothetical protein ACO1SX_14035 [Actinomycetota bacterium]